MSNRRYFALILLGLMVFNTVGRNAVLAAEESLDIVAAKQILAKHNRGKVLSALPAGEYVVFKVLTESGVVKCITIGRQGVVAEE